MTDAPPPAGWYPDGSTAGVLRWFDGTGWTEHVVPDPALAPPTPVVAAVPAPAAGVPAAPGTSGAAPSAFGAAPRFRLGQGLSVYDSVTTSPAFQQRLADQAAAIRRRAAWWFWAGLLVLTAVGGLGLAIRALSDVWIIGGIAGGFVLAWSVRDFRLARFRGARRLSVVARVLGALALVAALAVYVSVPVNTARQVQQMIEENGQGEDRLPRPA